MARRRNRRRNGGGGGAAAGSAGERQGQHVGPGSAKQPTVVIRFCARHETLGVCQRQATDRESKRESERAREQRLLRIGRVGDTAALADGREAHLQQGSPLVYRIRLPWCLVSSIHLTNDVGTSCIARRSVSRSKQTTLMSWERHDSCHCAT